MTSTGTSICLRPKCEADMHRLSFEGRYRMEASCSHQCCCSSYIQQKPALFARSCVQIPAAKCIPRPFLHKSQTGLAKERMRHISSPSTYTAGSLGANNTGREPDWAGELTVEKIAQKDKRVVVIGGGPAGSTAALYLAKRGFTVDIYEKRPEPSKDQVDLRRSYIIALSQRGVQALQEAGVKIPEQEVAYLGTCVQRFRGKRRCSPAGPGSVSFDRIELAQFLCNEVKRMYGDRVRYHFLHPCEGVDFDNRIVKLGTPSGEDLQVHYDLLIGADGANSVVRKQMEAQLPKFEVSVEDSGREYKTFRGLQADLEPPEFAGKRGRTIHLFLGNNSLTSLSCRRNQDGSYAGTLALKSGEFDQLESKQDYEDLVRKSVRGVPPHWAPEIAAQCLYAPTSSNGKRVRCSQLHGPGTVLLGDAAHAVTPIGGQGCNSALEDCKVLGEVLEQTGDDLKQVPVRWTSERFQDARALTNIEASLYKLVGGRKLGFLDPAFLRLVAHIALGTVLHKLMPWWFQPAALNQLGTPLPYSEIERRINRDALAMLLLVLAGLAFAAMKLLRWF